MSMQNFHSFLQRSPMRVAVQGQDSIYLAPVIPHKKLVGAQHYLPKHIRHEEILLLVDDTVFGSAKLGLVVTNAGLFYQTDFEDLAFYDFAHVLQVDVELGIVGVGRSTISEMMDEDSPYYDPTFPKKVKITQNRIGWSAWEIHQWIEDKLASRE